MNIVVLLKAVPVVGTERLGNDQMTDRSGQLEANGNDEYLLEKALKLTEEHGGEVTLLTVGPANGAEALRKALAMGAARAVHVVDDAVRGSDIRATIDVLEAALAQARIRPDLLRRRHVRWPRRSRCGRTRGAPRAALPVVRLGDHARRRHRSRAAAERVGLRRPGGIDTGTRHGHAAAGRAALPVAARDHAGTLQAHRDVDAGRSGHRPCVGRPGRGLDHGHRRGASRRNVPGRRSFASPRTWLSARSSTSSPAGGSI